MRFVLNLFIMRFISLANANASTVKHMTNVATIAPINQTSKKLPPLSDTSMLYFNLPAFPLHVQISIIALTTAYAESLGVAFGCWFSGGNDYDCLAVLEEMRLNQAGLK
jgi:hypothetical protein